MSQPTSPNAPAVVIEAPKIPPADRHRRIFAAFDQLQPGAAFELVNDHDPKPLHMQFQFLAAGRFQWEYLEQGPSRWRVRITRTQAAAPGYEIAKVFPASACGCGHDHGAPTSPALVTTAGERAVFRGDRFNPVEIARNERIKVVLACLEAGQFIPVHTPGVDLTLCVLDGRGVVACGEAEEPVTTGAIVFVPAGERRGLRADSRMTVLHVVTPPPSAADHAGVGEGLQRGAWK